MPGFSYVSDFFYPVNFQKSVQYLNYFFEQLGMLPTPFSFILVLHILIGYSTFLINIYWGILVFQSGIFCKCENFTSQLIHFVLLCCYDHNMLLTIDYVLSDQLNKC